jgi:membrane protein DedA with SNARE-associated domain
MLVGYQLGERQAEIMAQVKKYDLAVAVVIVLAIVAIGGRFVIRRRKEAASEPSKP